MITGVELQTNYFVFLSDNEISQLEFESIEGPVIDIGLRYRVGRLSLKLNEQDELIKIKKDEILILQEFYDELKENIPLTWLDFNYSLRLFDSHLSKKYTNLLNILRSCQ